MAEQFLYDFLSDFIGGVNSDLPPLKLQKDVAAWSTNCTLRGGFPRPRPARSRRTLTFPNAEIEAFFLAGYFQGGGWYRPDFGPSQLIAAVSGRLYSLTEISGSWAVADITVPGDPNLSTTNQVWMNQAEKWLIVTDGSAQLPIFYDGVTSRRSYGASVVMGSVTATSVGNPSLTPIGQTLVLTLAANYEGPFNVPVLFNGEFYQPIENAGSSPTYSVVLTAISTESAPGTNVPAGTSIVVRSDIIGITTQATNATSAIFCNSISTFTGLVKVSDSSPFIGFPTDTDPCNGTTGSAVLNIEGAVINFHPIVSNPSQQPPLFAFMGIVDSTTIRVRTAAASTGWSVPQGAKILRSSSSPDSLVGITTDAFSVPPQTGSVGVNLDRTYSGPSGQVVWIGDDQYTIAPGGSGTPSTLLTVINLTDTSATAYSLPQNILSVPELPAGRMGAYGLLHQAMSLIDGLSFIYGDTAGGPSGTPANNNRDAVLKVTENTFLESSGSFRVPSAGEIITSITFTAILDAAYGQGPLEIGTSSRIFTCAVPADRAAWIALENPILTVALIGDGPLAQDSTILANSDTLFRSTEGLGSLIFARRNFETWGNTPISTEVNRTIEADDNSLLAWGSAVTFDNRFLPLALPRTASSGVVHDAVLVLNFDPVSSLRGKAPSIWESVWDGLPVLRIVTGNFSGTKRCFMFAVENSQIVLWEQLRSKSPIYYDNGTDRITPTLESPCIFKPEERSDKIPMVRLTNGKIHIDQVRGEADITVEWRPDFHAGWTIWHTIHVNDQTAPGYLTPLGLGEPPIGACDAPNNRPLQSGRFFQIKVTCVGQAVIMGMEFSAVPEQEIIFPSPACETVIS